MTLRLPAAAVLLAALAVGLPAALAAPPDTGPVVVVELRAPLMPVAADYLERALAEAAARGAPLVLLELDTPGGLVTTVRRMVQAILDSPVPVAVYVGPAGASAASGGVFLVLAADVALMAPVADMGAAHPISPAGENREDDIGLTKAANELAALARSLAETRGRDVTVAEGMVKESHSFSAQEALAAGLVDGLVPDRSAALQWLHGRTVRRPDGEERQLMLVDVPQVVVGKTAREKLLSILSEPMVAFFLLALGLLGIYAEIMSPGTLLPAAVGVVCLLLFALASQMLPVNWLGAGLIVLGLGLFVLEVKVVSFGALTVGGLVCLVVGGLVLFDVPPELRLPRSFLAALSLTVSIIAVTLLRLAVKAQALPQATGRQALVGLVGEALTDVGAAGKVLVRGEYYDATARVAVLKGRQVQVEALDGLRVQVREVSGPEGE